MRKGHQMKYATLVISVLACFLSSSAGAQQGAEWLNQLRDPWLKTDQLKPENLLEEYRSYNFSTLLSPRGNFLGFIGSEYRRIHIYYTSVDRDPADPSLYHLRGITVVGEYRREFEGELRFDGMYEYKSMHFGLDDVYKDKGIRSQGVALGAYEFREPRGESHTGVFRGVMAFKWLVNRHEVVRMDNLRLNADSFANNQYVGTWQGYGEAEDLVCNWGEWRIPHSGDLDIGVGYFSINPKYYDMGWEDFRLDEYGYYYDPPETGR